MGCNASKHRLASSSGHKAAKKNKRKTNHHHRRKQMIEDESQVATSLTWAERGSSLRESVVCDKPADSSTTPVPSSSSEPPANGQAKPKKAYAEDSARTPVDLLTGDDVLAEDRAAVQEGFTNLQCVAEDKWPGEI